MRQTFLSKCIVSSLISFFSFFSLAAGVPLGGFPKGTAPSIVYSAFINSMKNARTNAALATSLFIQAFNSGGSFDSAAKLGGISYSEAQDALSAAQFLKSTTSNPNAVYDSYISAASEMSAASKTIRDAAWVKINALPGPAVVVSQSTQMTLTNSANLPTIGTVYYLRTSTNGSGAAFIYDTSGKLVAVYLVTNVKGKLVIVAGDESSTIFESVCTGCGLLNGDVYYIQKDAKGFLGDQFSTPSSKPTNVIPD